MAIYYYKIGKGEATTTTNTGSRDDDLSSKKRKSIAEDTMNPRKMSPVFFWTSNFDHADCSPLR